MLFDMYCRILYVFVIWPLRIIAGRRALWDEAKLRAVEIECGLREPDPQPAPPPGRAAASDPCGSVPVTAGGPGLDGLATMWARQDGPFAARDMTEAEMAEWDLQMAVQLDLDRRQRESTDVREKALIAREQRREYEEGRRKAERWLKSDLSRGSME